MYYYMYMNNEYACDYHSNMRFKVIRSITLGANVSMIHTLVSNFDITVTDRNGALEMLHYDNIQPISLQKIKQISMDDECFEHFMQNLHCNLQCNKVLLINSMLNIRCSSKPYRKCYFTLQSLFFFFAFEDLPELR